MSVIIRLQNLPLSASAMDIRVFFHGLSIPDGGVHIVGGQDGDAFIAFSSDEDARQAMNLSGQQLKDCTIKLLLSSRSEMFKVIEQTRQASMAGSSGEEQSQVLSGGSAGPSAMANTSTQNQNSLIGSSQGESGGINASALNSSLAPSPASNISSVNSLPNLNMTLAGFPGSLNMNLPNNMAAFQNMKLTPQEINSLMSGAALHGMFQQPNQQSGAQTNAFMLSNMGLAATTPPNPMLQPNSLGFPGLLPGILPQGMSLSGMMNQVQPQLTVNTNAPPMGNLPFNNTAGLRMGAIAQMHRNNPNQTNLGFMASQNIPNPSIMQNGIQPNLHNINGRQNFNQDMNNLNRIRFNQDDISKRGPPFRANAATPGFDQTRDRGMNLNRDRETNQIREREMSQIREREMNQIRDREMNPIRDREMSQIRDREVNQIRDREVNQIRDRELNQNRERDRGRDRVPVEELDKTGRLRRRRSDSGEARDLRDRERRRRSRSRSRSRERPRREGRRSRSRSRSRNRGDRDSRASNTRRNLNRSNSREPVATIAPDGRNVEIDPRNPTGSGRELDEFCCLVIHGLPVNFNGLDVATITLEGVSKTVYSDIHIHEEPMDRNGRQFATAFVKFHSRAEAEKAIGLISKNHGDRFGAVVTDIEELQKIRQSVLKPLIISPRDPERDRRGGPEAIPLFELDLDMESCSVMLKGVPLNMNERDVFDFFSDLGLNPKRVKFLTDQPGNRIGKVICEFNDTAQARQALAKDGQLFGRNTVQVHMLPRRGDNTFPLHSRGRGGILGNRPGPFPPQHPRFQSNINQSENPFIQALNASNGGPIPPSDIHMRGNMRGGMRGRGFGRGRGVLRPSRFAPADSTTNDNSHNNENPPSFFERKGCVLAVTNIPFSANMDHIILFLEETLEHDVPHDRIIRRYNEFQKPTGDARIAFDSQYETKQACERLQGKRMWNRVLEVTII